MIDKENFAEDLLPEVSMERRRKLLPIWIKIFLLIFLVFGAIAPVGLILGLFDISISLSLYGLETTNALSVTGLLIIVLFAVKGVVSFGLWTEKEWAVNLAIMDGAIGIIACSIIMIVLPFLSGNNGFNINFRFELAILIPYLIKMIKINTEWKSRS